MGIRNCTVSSGWAVPGRTSRMKKFVRKTRSWGLPSWYRGYLGGGGCVHVRHRTQDPGAPLADHGSITHRSSSSRKPREQFSPGQRPRVPLVHCTVWPSVGPKTRVPTTVCGLRPLGKDLSSASSNWPAVGPQPRFTPQQGRASLAQTLRGGEKHPSPGPANPLPHPERAEAAGEQ